VTPGQPQRSIIVVHPDFDRTWPWAADHFRDLWDEQGQTEFLRLAPDDRRPLGEIVADPAGITRLVALNVPVTRGCAARMTALREAVISPRPPTDVGEALRAAGVRTYVQPGEGFWGQSVAEFALAADVWDAEPLPRDDPLLGRHNVVHTPHNAGRTRDANLAWAENLAVQFGPQGV
jgi:hypothetical protein